MNAKTAQIRHGRCCKTGALPPGKNIARPVARRARKGYGDHGLPKLYKNPLAFLPGNLHNNPQPPLAMNTFRKVHSAAVASALSLFLLPAAQSFGQTTATTDPVGYTALTLYANADTQVSIPFARPSTFVGAIGSVSTDSGTGLTTITTAASPGWTPSQYKYAPTATTPQTNTYFALIGPKLTTVSGTVTVTNANTTVTAATSGAFAGIVAGDELIVNGLAYNIASVAGDNTSLVLSRAFTGTTASGQTATYDHSPKEGSYYTVVDNGSNTLTFSLNGDSLPMAAVAGATVSLIPYWTLGTAFPVSDVGVSYIATTGGSAPRFRKTQILLPDLVTADIDLAPSAIYFNYNGHWTPDGTTVADDVVLLPTTYFTVRNGSTGTTFTPTGNVVMNRVSTPLDTRAGGGQDNAVAVPRPTGVTLNDLNLISSGAFVASTGDAPRFRKDLLLVYENSATAGTDKAPSAIYYYYGNIWRSAASMVPATDVGDTLIAYGTGFKIRKAAVTGGITSFWQNTRNY